MKGRGIALAFYGDSQIQWMKELELVGEGDAEKT